IGAQRTDRFANLIFLHAHDVVDIGTHVFEIDLPNALGAETVGKGLRNLAGREGDNVPCAQAGLRVGREFRFHADHLDCGIRQLDRGRNSADESAPADRDEHSLNLRQILKNLKAHGPLASDDLFVVVWRDNHVAVLGGQLLGPQTALFAARPNGDDLGSQRGSRFELVLRRIARHDDNRLQAQSPRRVGHSLPMISAGIRDHAAAPLLVAEGSNLVIGSTQLEGADRLQIFKLEKKFPLRGDTRPLQQGSADGNAMKQSLRGEDVVERNHRCDSTVSLVLARRLYLQYHRHDQRSSLRLPGDVALQIGADLFFDHAVIGFLFGAGGIEGLHDDLAGALDNAVFSGSEAARHNLRRGFDPSREFVDGNDRHHEAIFAQVAAVVDYQVLYHIRARAGIDADAAYVHAARFACAQFVDFQYVSAFDQHHVADRAAHRARQLGMELELAVFAVDGN